VVGGGALDLSRREPAEALDREQALTIIATRDPAMFARHTLEPSAAIRGELRLNPLYVQEASGDRVRLRLQFPSDDYAQEYAACRRYLPEEVVVDRRDLDVLPATSASPALEDLIQRRVVLDLPRHYY
jgi:hypothetical protein